MKLTIKQDNLARALNAVGRVATAKAGMPILANILLRTDQNKLTIAAKPKCVKTDIAEAITRD